MNHRANQVRVALAGFEVGDRVVVFRDTKSTLGRMFTVYPDGLPGVITSLEGIDCRHSVVIDPLVANDQQWGGHWFVHPDDMRLE